MNPAEALRRVADRGGDPSAVMAQLTDSGLLEGAIAVEPFTAADAGEVARLRAGNATPGSRGETGHAWLSRDGPKSPH